MGETQIPVIEIEAFRLGRPRGMDVSARVRNACETIGFFFITGHGVPAGVIDELMKQARLFFDRTPEEKSKIGRTGTNFGGPIYTPLEAESLAATLGQQGLADLKECIDAGPRFLGDRWPIECGDLAQAWHRANGEFCDLAAVLRALFADAMGLPKDGFEPAFDRHSSSMRVLNYPEIASPLKPGQVRAGVHTDYGAFTILRGDDTPGLQVRRRDGAWINAPAIPDSFVVNIGDALMRWTNDRWVSTPHRVVGTTGDGASARRQSAAFFHNPSPDTVIECLPPFLPEDGKGSYPPITYQSYAEQRFQQSHNSSAPLVIDTRRQ